MSARAQRGQIKIGDEIFTVDMNEPFTCKKLPLDYPCAHGWQCSSGSCWNNFCSSKAALGQGCNSNGDCAGDVACAWGQEKQKICCPGNEKGVDWQNDCDFLYCHAYCKGLSEGDSCAMPWQCSSNKCVGNKCT